LKTDFVFVLRRLDDKGILDLLKQANGMDDLFKHFCVELLKSTRSDAVWSKSAELLYSCVSEMMPFPFNREIALARFAPKSKTSSVKEAPATQVQKVSRRVHTVQEGENLWKIARSYKVQVDEIVALNGLEKDKIQPGMMLQIP
jgi:LysM repeat protein